MSLCAFQTGSYSYVNDFMVKCFIVKYRSLLLFLYKNVASLSYFLMIVSDISLIISWAQFHKGLLNIEDSRLLKLDLNRPLVTTTKVFH